jgi:hypothetical protein
VWSLERSTLALVCLGVAVVTTACGSPADQAAEKQATDLRSALASQDGDAACAALAPRTASELEQSAGKPCPRAILEEKLPTDGEVSGVRVFGTMAQVKYDGETVFLSRFPDGWRVSAVGCTEGAAGLYDCAVEGG